MICKIAKNNNQETETTPNPIQKFFHNILGRVRFSRRLIFLSIFSNNCTICIGSSLFKRKTPISKFMVQIGGVFNKMLKEYAEMYYLNESPVILSGEKLKKELGDIRQISYEVGIMNTLDQMKPFHELS